MTANGRFAKDTLEVRRRTAAKDAYCFPSSRERAAAPDALGNHATKPFIGAKLVI
jgi:hypothetical protein